MSRTNPQDDEMYKRTTITKVETTKELQSLTRVEIREIVALSLLIF